MSFAINDFLHSLALYIVSRAASAPMPETIVYASTTPRDLWIHFASEDAAGDPYSTLIPTGGPSSVKHPTMTNAIQCFTRGTDSINAMTRAQAIFDTLRDDDGSPLRMTTITGKKFADNSADGQWLIRNIDWVQPPGIVSKDDRGRIEISFNLDIAVQKVS